LFGVSLSSTSTAIAMFVTLDEDATKRQAKDIFASYMEGAAMRVLACDLWMKTKRCGEFLQLW
jgi:hypothetical protein